MHFHPLALVSLLVLLAAGCGTEPPPAAKAADCTTSADCAWLDDGDACNGGFACVEGACAFDPASVVSCDPKGDSACKANACDPKTGGCALTPRNEGLPCDDGAPCTLGDVCEAGACKAGTTNACECQTTADCKDDDDKCNGAPLCDTSIFPHRCTTNPATVVTCKDDGDPCTVETCAPKTGTCATVPAPEGSPCNDGDPCTGGDACTNGKCAGPTATCGCNKDGDCADTDGDPCTGVPFCDTSSGKGSCKVNPATVVTCSTKADTACTKNTCNKLTGSCVMTPVAADTACDDGDACTKGEVCVGGTCAAGTDICTCSTDADCDGKDDGNKCNGLPFCNKASGKCETNPATKVVCPTAGDSDCAKNVCIPKTGACVVLPRAEVKLAGCVDVDLGGGVQGKQCAWLPATATQTGSFACSDGNPCTVGDTCNGTQCKGGKTTCECTKDTDCVDPDGDKCTGVPFCDTALGTCKTNPASVVYCDKSDDTACLKATCAPKTGGCGLKPIKDGAACDDGDTCTTGDTCQAGTCKAGKVTCACLKDADCPDKDGDKCNGVPFCDLSSHTCKPNPSSAVFCDKAKDGACLKAACDPKTGGCGLKPVKTGTSCDDGQPCTSSDACTGTGSCAGVKATVCDDKDPCTVDSCAKGKGCVHAAKACSDGNACTLDGCDPKTGACKTGFVAKGKACNADSDGCTVGDSCDGKGSCASGSAALCVGDTGACEVMACQSKGVDGFTCAKVARPNGSACPDGDACFTNATCQSGVCKAGTTSTLWSVSPTVPGAMSFEAGLLLATPIPGAAGDGTGAAVVAGALTSGTKSGHWQVMALGRDGKTLWSGTVAPPSGVVSLGPVVAVVDRATAGVVVVGGAMRSDGAQTAVSVVISLSGKVGAPVAHTHAGKPLHLVPSAAVNHPSGNLVLAGAAPDTSLALAMRSVTGAEVWTQSRPVPTGKVVRLVAMPTGALAFLAQIDNATYSGVFHGAVTAAGDKLWEFNFAQKKPSLSVALAGMLTDQGHLRVFNALSESASKPPHQRFWYSVDIETGAVTRGDRTHEDPSVWPVGTHEAGDRAVWYGLPTAKGVPVGALDYFSNVLWSRLVEGAPQQPRGIRAGPKGERLMLFGADGVGAKAKPRVTLVDRWGFSSCGDRGACAALSWAKCGDGTDCTADGCDATAGCTHAPNKTNLCNPGIACTGAGACGTGVCVPDHYGRVFVRGRHYGEGVSEVGLTLNGDNDPVAWQLEGGQIVGVTVDRKLGEVNTAFVAGTQGTQGPGKMTVNAAGVHALAATVAGPPHYARLLLFAKGFNEAPLITDIKDPGCSNCNVVTSSAAASKDGAFYVGAGSTQFGAAGVMARVGANGKLQWTRIIGSQGARATVLSLRARANGSVMWVGQQETSKGIFPGLNWVGADNKGFGQLQDTQGSGGYFLDCAERGDGSMVAVGAVPDGAVETSIVATYSSAGKLLWRQSPKLADGMRLSNVLVLGDGSLGIAGRGVVGGVHSAVLQRWTGGGEPLWKREHRFAGKFAMSPEFASLTQLDDGGFAFAAHTDWGNSTKGHAVVRSDPWGFISCLEAGACASLKMDACDDKNPCTADWCDSKSKCQHAKLDGAACGVGGVCQAGVCK